MNFTPDDPRLTAYLLGELSPDEVSEVEAAAAADPAMWQALREMESLGQYLTDHLFATHATLKPAQRQRIIEASRQSKPTTRRPPIRLPRLSNPWSVGLATAGAIALMVFILTKTSPTTAHEPPPVATIDSAENATPEPIDFSLLPAPGPIDANRETTPDTGAASKFTHAITARNEALVRWKNHRLDQPASRLNEQPIPEATELPPLIRRNSVLASASPQLALPVHAGNTSLGWIAHSIRKGRQMPPPDAVRVEEILNHFPLRPAGPTAVSQGVTVSTETLSCPWKPSASLLIIAFRGAVDSVREIQATFQADPEAVFRYRLLGFSPIAETPESGTLPTHLPAKALTVIAIEIESKNAVTTFGSIQWSVNQQPAAEISLTRRSDAEPSDDARFASLLCAYGQWLAGDQSGIIDAEIVAALAREVHSDTLSPDRFDLLTLIDETLNL